MVSTQLNSYVKNQVDVLDMGKMGFFSQSGLFTSSTLLSSFQYKNLIKFIEFLTQEINRNFMYQQDAVLINFSKNFSYLKIAF